MAEIVKEKYYKDKIYKYIIIEMTKSVTIYLQYD